MFVGTAHRQGHCFDVTSQSGLERRHFTGRTELTGERNDD